MSNKNSVAYEYIEKVQKKMKSRSYHPGRNPRLLKQCIQELPDFIPPSSKNCNIYNHQYSTISSQTEIDTTFGLSLKNTENPNAIIAEYLQQTNSIAIYTDESKNSDKPVGCACICPVFNIKIQHTVSSSASVFTAEAIALSEATNIIFSDSLSVLSSLSSLKVKVTINQFILQIK